MLVSETDNMIQGKYFILENDNRFPLEIPKEGWKNLKKDKIGKYPNYIIYLIRCGKRLYVGSDKISTRFATHKSELKHNKHGNFYMQNVYNKYGVESFEYIILCEIPKEYHDFKNEIENSYIKLFNTFHERNINGFNLCEFASNSSYRIIKKFKLIDPQGNVVEVKGMLEFCKKYDLDNSYVAEVLDGRKVNCRGWRKFDESLIGVIFDRKTYMENVCKSKKNVLSGKIIDPEGNVLEYKSLNFFCKERNLNTAATHHLILGDIKSYKGYRKYCKDLEGVKFTGIIKDHSSPSYDLISPENIRYKGNDLKSFCLNNNLKYNPIKEVVKFRKKSHKGWKNYIKIGVII